MHVQSLLCQSCLPVFVSVIFVILPLITSFHKKLKYRSRKHTHTPDLRANHTLSKSSSPAHFPVSIKGIL